MRGGIFDQYQNASAVLAGEFVDGASLHYVFVAVYFILVVAAVLLFVATPPVWYALPTLASGTRGKILVLVWAQC